VLPFAWADDFAAARNYAFENCSGDWILWLDADDVITEDNQRKILALKDQLGDHLDGVFASYNYSHSPQGECTFAHLRERFIRRAAGLRWDFPVHECLAIPAGRSLDCPDIAIKHSPLPAKQASKVDRNLKILQAAVANGDRRPRILFYLGNELKDHGRFREAILVYQEYFQVSDQVWEKYWAHLSLIRCFQQVGELDKARQLALQAILLDSQRAEAYIQLGIYEYDRRNWAQAIPYLQTAARLEKPLLGFADSDAYSWQPHDYLSICYANLGLYPAAIETTLKALPSNPHRERILKNLHWMVDQL
jgi:tetratricopeptide (TPR) repeat protein